MNSEINYDDVLLRYKVTLVPDIRFFYLEKRMCSCFLHFKGYFERAQENSECRDRALM